MLEGDGAVHALGGKSTQGLVVRIADEIGRPVEGAAVSFRLPEEGPGGTFGHGMRTDIIVTGPDGLAAVHGIQCNRLPGPFQVRVTAVKDQIRAGVIVAQFLSEKSAAGSAPALAKRSGRRKWLVLTGVIAGGAAAGLALGMGGGGSAPSAGAITTPTAPPQIGAPSISVGRP